MGNTVADEANATLKTTTIAVPLKYLSKFRVSLEIKTEFEPKVELKLKRTNHWILSAAVADNGDANFHNIIFTIKDTELYVPVVTLSAKDNQKPLELLSKGFE